MSQQLQQSINETMNTSNTYFTQSVPLKKQHQYTDTGYSELLKRSYSPKNIKDKPRHQEDSFSLL